MSANLGLYSVKALLILDNEGERLYTNYYTPPKEQKGDEENDGPLSTLKKQQAFEKALFAKTFKQNGDIILFESHIVVYKEVADIVIYVVGGLSENEVALSSVVDGFKEALDKILNYQVDKKAVQENYDKVCIAVDETVDDGIILETEPSIIAARVSNTPKNEPSLKNIDLSEKGFMNAFQFAKGKLAERLQQGL